MGLLNLIKDGIKGENTGGKKTTSSTKKNGKSKKKSNLKSSAGWEKNDTSRAAANPMKGTHAAWDRKDKHFKKVRNSKAYLDHMQNVSQQFGDTEFVGGLIDSLTSNRYFPGEGGNKGMGALAGNDRGLGPDSIDGMDRKEYLKLKKNGWPLAKAKEYATVDDDYRGFINRQDLTNNISGGTYQGPTDYRDPAFGLVRLGLYGGGLGDTNREVTDAIVNNFTGRGAEEQNVEDTLLGARLGYQDSIDYVNEYLPDELKEGFEWYPGGLLQERDDWVGGIKTKPGMLHSEDRYGVYMPYDNDVTIDPNVRGIDDTTSHELIHRGIGALERDYRAYGQNPKNWEWLEGGNTNMFDDVSRINLGTDPDTGKKVSMDEFLKNRNIGQGDSKSTGDQGHSFEHNMINAVARNRAQRSAFLGFGNSAKDFGNVFKQNKQRAENVEGLNKLGLLGHAIVDAQQKQKYDYVKDTRDRLDTPRVFGGKSGTAVHPIMKAAGY